MNDQQKPRILLVDDDEDSMRLLRSVFQEADFEVMSAFDGLEGLDLATKHLPDVIITGVVMPRMSGFEMMRSLKSGVKTAKIPILIYSHLGREEDRVQAVELGARDFLIRSLITPNEIVERTKRVVVHGKTFYVEFDPQEADAKEIAQTFNLKPYFECPDGSRMVLRLEPLPNPGEVPEFRATFVCRIKE